MLAPRPQLDRRSNGLKLYMSLNQCSLLLTPLLIQRLEHFQDRNRTKSYVQSGTAWHASLWEDAQTYTFKKGYNFFALLSLKDFLAKLSN